MCIGIYEYYNTINHYYLYNCFVIEEEEGGGDAVTQILFYMCNSVFYCLSQSNLASSLSFLLLIYFILFPFILSPLLPFFPRPVG